MMKAPPLWRYLRTVVKTLTGIDGGPLERYIGAKAIKPFIDKDLTMEQIIDFGIG